MSAYQPFSSYEEIMQAASKERIRKAAETRAGENKTEAQSVVHTELHDSSEHKKDCVAKTLAIVCAILAASATMLSIYYTYEWFSSRMPPFGAALMTGTIVLVVIISPQIIGEFRKRGKKGVIFFLVAVDIVATSYSMITTVGSLYDSQSESYVEYKESDDKSRLLKERSENAQERVERAKRSAESFESDKERYRAQVVALEAQSDYTSKEHATAQARYDKAVRSYNEAVKLLADLESKQDLVLESSIESTSSTASADRSDFITWIASFLPFERKWTELLVNGLPAIFTDIVAPLFFRSAILLYRKEEE